VDAGFTLDIPRMFAALFPINLAGIGSFGAMVVLSKLALSDWHESEIGAET
jgi:NitT/TauT family transport system permease protein